MKRFLACLALCASLSASAQDDNCTVLGVQELSSLYADLSTSINAIVTSLQSAVDSPPKSVVGYQVCRHWTTGENSANMALVDSDVKTCVDTLVLQGYVPLGPQEVVIRATYSNVANLYNNNHFSQYIVSQTMVKYADD